MKMSLHRNSTHRHPKAGSEYWKLITTNIKEIDYCTPKTSFKTDLPPPLHPYKQQFNNWSIIFQKFTKIKLTEKNVKIEKNHASESFE